MQVTKCEGSFVSKASSRRSRNSASKPFQSKRNALCCIDMWRLPNNVPVHQAAGNAFDFGSRGPRLWCNGWFCGNYSVDLSEVVPVIDGYFFQS